MFPDQETARVYLEQNLWPEGPRCPVCGLSERITTRKDGFYRCNQCKEDFTVRTGMMCDGSSSGIDASLSVDSGAASTPVRRRVPLTQ
jgi:transposase-like protein